MKNFIKNFFSSVNNFLTRGFFYVIDSFDPILVFLTTFWVYSIFIALLTMIALKIFMGFVLGSHVVGKFIFICMFVINFLPHMHFLFQDFSKALLSFTELCKFLVFSTQVVIMLIAGFYDFIQYILYHRYGFPCYYFAENVDTMIENCLVLFSKFFINFFS